MALKLMCELGIRLHMQKQYLKTNTFVTVNQRLNLINHRWIYLATFLNPETRKVQSDGYTMTANLTTSAL